MLELVLSGWSWPRAGRRIASHWARCLYHSWRRRRHCPRRKVGS